MDEPTLNTNSVHVHPQYDVAESDEESEHLLKTESLSKMEQEEVPHDRFQIVYSIFFLLGVCSVLPWNMFITGNEYFHYKFRDTNTTENGTDLQSMFEGYFSVAAMLPNIFAQILNLALQHRISLQIRVVCPLLGMLFFFVLTSILTRINTDEWQLWFFIICMVSIVLINSFGAVYQGSVFGIAGILPKRYMQAIMSGQGMGGILPSLLSIISIAGTNNPADSGFIYFLCSVVCIIITIVAFLFLPKIRYAAYYLNKHAEMTKTSDCGLENTASFEKVAQHEKPPFMAIFWKIKLAGLMVLIVFAVTLGLFPGTLSLVGPLNTRNRFWAGNYFSPVACFLVFNTMDFTGRTLSVIQWPKASHMPIISALVLLRLVFFPLFAFCNIDINNHTAHVVFNNDAYFIVFNALFGLSNGYLGSLLMIYGPKFVDVKYSETAGVMMSLFLGSGLALGAIISVAFLEIL